MPEDPPEPGACVLKLSIVDAGTGKPTKSRVRLYRIDAPGNEHWTRGDRLRGKYDVPTEGHEIVGLAAGTYRLSCAEQEATRDDDRAFFVSGAITRWTVHVHLPRKFTAWLNVHWPEGRRVKSASLKNRREATHNWNTPAWFTPREPRHADRYVLSLAGSGGGSFSRHGTRFLNSAPTRYSLGTYSGDSRGRQTRATRFWSGDGLTSVKVTIKGDRTDDREFTGIAYPVELVHAAVFLPDGSRAIDKGASIGAVCEAVEGSIEGARSQPLLVWARLEGYETLQFEFDPRTVPSPRTMVPIKQPLKKVTDPE
ncbi:MAG: hypothetical protein ACYTGZ_19265 [Planctomycetota bacterium]